MINSSNLPKGKLGGYIALCITCIVWGTTWVASKVAIEEDIPALQMASIRQFFGGAAFVLFFMLYRKLPFPTWQQVIIEMVFYKSRNMTVLTFVGLLLGLTGIGIVFYESAFQHQPDGFLFGVILSVIAMLSWSVGTLFLTRNSLKMNPYYAIGWQMLIGSFLLFIFALATGQMVALKTITTTAWLMIAYLVCAGSILSFVAFIFSMKRLPVAVASLYAYINPLVAMVVAAFVLNEKLTVYILWGSIVTMVGVFLVNYSVKQRCNKLLINFSPSFKFRCCTQKIIMPDGNHCTVYRFTNS